MLLIADSGSTKCDWYLETEGGVYTHTIGFNPMFHDSTFIEEVLQANVLLSKSRLEVSKIYFYGASCSSPDRIETITKALSNFFPKAEVHVGHDLLGSALSTCGNNAGISCILGTGSNACYYDGQTVHRAKPALGFILGDEGSGSYFGKILLREYLYQNLPEEIQNDFSEQYHLDKDQIFKRVYQTEGANRFLASFMPFVDKHRQHSYMQNLLYDGLLLFVRIHISPYPEFRKVPVHFVGSVAYYFSDVLEKISKDLGFTLGKIVQRPIDGLRDYHLS
jgi:N-acetylglucosamine kinase-like BadF-type ATPase